jgi:hypothetical protein
MKTAKKISGDTILEVVFISVIYSFFGSVGYAMEGMVGYCKALVFVCSMFVLCVAFCGGMFEGEK